MIDTPPEERCNGHMPRHVLAIDIGTSSSRAALIDEKGRQVAGTLFQRPYPLISDHQGRAELAPRRLEQAVRFCIAGALRSRPGRGLIVDAVGVSCFWHSLLGLDAKGAPITPIYTFADFRSSSDAARLRRHHREALVQARTGCMIRFCYWPAKLAWLRRTDPRLFERVTRWVSAGEWIQQVWCGRASVSISMASATGLLNQRSLQWDAPLLRAVRLSPHRLNPLSDEPLRVTKSAPPRLRGVPWYPAIGDGAAGNLGSDAVTSRIGAINVGTSGALRLLLPAGPKSRPLRIPRGLFCYRLDARRLVVGGATSNAGNLHAWARRELSLPGAAEIERALSKRPGPILGLTILPFWIGERAPTWPESLPSVIVGTGQSTTALDLLQALHEASYQRLAEVAGLLEKALRRKLSFIVSGGIAHSPESVQRLADVLGRPVAIAAQPEASLRGAALFALGRIGSAAPRVRALRPIRPRARFARAYEVARQRQIELEELIARSRRGRDRHGKHTFDSR
jgi:gluconokinase